MIRRNESNKKGTETTEINILIKRIGSNFIILKKLGNIS
jgi:hypothetical protein